MAGCLAEPLKKAGGTAGESAGVEAEFVDEFITLFCCSYHVEDGRFVVVGKRVDVSDADETP